MAGPGWTPLGLEVFTRKDFPDGRLNRPGTFVVCFGAMWCPVTRRFMPKFLGLKGKLPGTLAIADITDTKDPLWDTFRIRITPSILVFRDGVVQMRVDGRRFFGVTKSALAGLETAHLSA
jgi:thioredoxin-like negative regulator of GroEL